LDVKHFDQSALAALISTILMMPILLLPDDGSVEYKMMKAFIMERAHQMACKLVKWEEDEYRYILGQVFSGLYVTSWLDSIYMVIIVTCVLTAMYQELKKTDPPRAEEFMNSFVRRLQYGDNSLYGFEVKFLDVVCGGRNKDKPLGKFQDLLYSMFGMELKSEETFLYTPDDSGLSPLFTVVEPVYNEFDIYVANKITRDGPEFLKRKFIIMEVRGKWQIMPWRCEDDFYTKCSITASIHEFKPDKWSSKYVGLMIDTMGTNDIAYDAMQHMFIDSLQRSSADTTKNYRDYVDRMEGVDDPIDSEVKKVLARTGITEKDAMRLCMNQGRLIDEFVYDDKWRKRWARANSLNLYNSDGTIRADANFEGNFYHTSTPNYRNVPNLSERERLNYELNDEYDPSLFCLPDMP